jgi:hypothetical protein
MAAGAVSNGAPGLRPDYSPTYYAAFVIDPDGQNVEAVWAPASPPRPQVIETSTLRKWRRGELNPRPNGKTDPT